MPERGRAGPSSESSEGGGGDRPTHEVPRTHDCETQEHKETAGTWEAGVFLGQKKRVLAQKRDQGQRIGPKERGGQVSAGDGGRGR